jgi:hypothetical protein
MPSVRSYFNPFSSQHHALREIGSVSAPKQGLIWAVSVIVGLMTLGVGGVATFRALTRHFSKIDLNDKLRDHQKQVEKTAFKTQTTYLDVLNNYYREHEGKGLKPVRDLIKGLEGVLLDAKVDDSSQEDTFFKIACHYKSKTSEEFKDEFKDYIISYNNRHLRNDILTKSGVGTLDFHKKYGIGHEEVVKLLTSENIPGEETLKGKNKDTIVDLQSEINRIRCEFLAHMLNCTVKLHEVEIMVGSDKPHSEKTREYSSSFPESIIEIVSGTLLDERATSSFIHPRELGP